MTLISVDGMAHGSDNDDVVDDIDADGEIKG